MPSLARANPKRAQLKESIGAHPTTHGHKTHTTHYHNHHPDPHEHFAIRGIPGYAGHRRAVGPDNTIGAGWTEAAQISMMGRRPHSTGHLLTAAEDARRCRMPNAGAMIPGYSGWIPGKFPEADANGRRFAMENARALSKKPSTAPMAYRHVVSNNMWNMQLFMDFSIKPGKVVPCFPKKTVKEQKLAKNMAVSQVYGIDASWKPQRTGRRESRKDPWETALKNGPAGARYFETEIDRHRSNEHRFMVTKGRLVK